MSARHRFKEAPPAAPAADLWYAAGLRFTCTECGNCCTGDPGYVYVIKEQIDRIAAFLGRDGQGLTSRHLRRVGRRYCLTEARDTGDCCFLQHVDGRSTCSIYPVRPLQCRTWPFWDGNLDSPDAWADVSRGCPGMNNGRHHELIHIETRRCARRGEDLPA
jgi:hypothetical protein